jgi:hypothetical protein
VVIAYSDHHWRLTVRFESSDHTHRVLGAMKTHAAAALAADRLKEGVAAERDEEWLRIYAGSVGALRRAQVIVAKALEAEGVQAEERAEHRTGDHDEWERVDLPPLPDRDESLVSEHHGMGPWGSEAEPDRVQVHFELGTRRAAKAFAEELASEGYDVHQAESFMFVFADDGAAAHKLGNELKDRAPANARLFFEGEGRMIFL